jgi:hypothetical protein
MSKEVVGGDFRNVVSTNVGWVSHFYDTHWIRFSKKIIKRFGFHLFSFPLKFIYHARVYIYIYIKPVFNMSLLKKLRTTYSPLLVLTNQVLLLIDYY